MIKTIKKLLRVHKLNKELSLTIVKQGKIIRKLEEHSTNPEMVIAHILDRGIQWFDYQELPKDGQIIYYNEAKQILRTQVFNNETNRAIQDLISDIAGAMREGDEAKDRKRRDLAFIIVGMEAVKVRLNGIIKPQEEPTTDNLNKSI